MTFYINDNFTILGFLEFGAANWVVVLLDTSNWANASQYGYDIAIREFVYNILDNTLNMYPYPYGKRMNFSLITFTTTTKVLVPLDTELDRNKVRPIIWNLVVPSTDTTTKNITAALKAGSEMMDLANGKPGALIILITYGVFTEDMDQISTYANVVKSRGAI